ncbi:MAG: transglycosylase domain-containing protein, partial [Patescibacteria group bacterium]|nr:transglycosylase domain-containing protein [Patescibacteria group bacterium]
WYILRDLPSPIKLSSNNIPQSTQIFDRNGTLLYTIYNKKNQTFLSLDTIPKTVQEATIAIEDKDFYNHGPIDLRGIARALFTIVFHKQIQGGSTITQQLVKNTLLSPEQTIVRKIREAILAFATELLYPKNKILELYLNQIPYGGTTYGIEAAAQTYFGKHARDLDLAESTLLAGLPEAPTTYSPFGSHPELAKERQILVLKAMEDQKYITAKQEEDAAKEPLKYQHVANIIQAPHFSLYIKDLLIKKYGEKTVEEGGLKVITSLDLSIQNMAQDIVATEIAKLKPLHVTNGASLVTNPATGEILAMVGSKDYFDSSIDGNVNVTLAHRQPGSSIKPINYALGLIKGYTAATPFIDEPTCFPNPGHPDYCPVNYDGKWHGVVQMRIALGNSINIPAVKMLKVNGVEAMIATASAMGIHTFGDPSKYGLSLTLGGGEVTMLDMATAYGVFANGGYRVDLQPILEVIDHTGKILEQYKPPTSPIFGVKVLPQGVAYIISDMLSDNGARLIDFGPSSELVIPKHDVSVKTGTTNDFRDNWTIGYTPSYVVAAWVGNDDNTPMSSLASGITGAAPIWHNIMVKLLDDKPDEQLPRPSDVIQKAVCSTSGLIPPPDGTPNRCPVRFEYFIKGTEPKMF